jgi:predicted O-methyltransferase YrrM
MKYRYREYVGGNDEIKNNIAYIINKFGLPSTTIEIGTYYGMTSVWMAELIAPHNPDYHHYTIDPHSTSVEMGDDFDEVHRSFLHNKSVCEYGNHITHLHKNSFDALIELRNQGVKPQFIFIDGDHTASTVLSDLVLSFEMLPSGGVILCDDVVHWYYEDKHGNRDPQMCPRMAMESFVMCHWSKIRPLVLPSPFVTQAAFIKL